MKNHEIKKGEIIIYKSKEGPKLDVRLEEDTVWLTQKQMAVLFDKGIPTINEHIKNIFKEGELQENSVIRKFRTTASDGKTYETKFYNLDIIISVKDKLIKIVTNLLQHEPLSSRHIGL